MKTLNKIKFFAYLSLLISGNLLLSTSNTFAYSINKNIQSMPEGSYQIARSIFLPDAKDDIWLPKGNYNKSECGKIGYPLKDCPEHGICSPCPIDSSYYKLNSCKNDGNTKYVVNSSKTDCEPRCDVVECTGYTYNKVSDIPEGWNYEECKSVADNCAITWKYKKGTTCKEGYYKKDGECIKNCSSQQCTSLYSGKTIIDNKSEFYDTSIAEFTYLGKGKTYTCEDVDCYSFIRCKYPYTKGSGAHCYCQSKTCGEEYNFSSIPSNAYYEDCTEVKSLNGKCTASKKYKITSCYEGYHLDGFCQQDCVPGTNAGAGTYDIKQFPYETKEECQSQGNAKSCMGISFYTDKLCNTKVKYTVRACKEGYTAKKTDNGIICENSCTPKTCDSSFNQSSCPKGANCESCTNTDNNCQEGTTKYKIISCQLGYKLEGGTCVFQGCKNKLVKISETESLPELNKIIPMLVNNDLDLKEAIKNYKAGGTPIIITDDFNIIDYSEFAKTDSSGREYDLEIIGIQQYLKDHPEVLANSTYANTPGCDVMPNLTQYISMNVGAKTKINALSFTAGNFVGEKINLKGEFSGCKFYAYGGDNSASLGIYPLSTFNNCQFSGANLLLKSDGAAYRFTYFTDVNINGGKTFIEYNNGPVYLNLNNVKFENNIVSGGINRDEPDNSQNFIADIVEIEGSNIQNMIYMYGIASLRLTKVNLNGDFSSNNSIINAVGENYYTSAQKSKLAQLVANKQHLLEVRVRGNISTPQNVELVSYSKITEEQKSLIYVE